MNASLSRFAPIKINLFLEVLGKRPDGFHEVATIMETLSVGDTVCATASDDLVIESDRPDVPTGPDNTVHKVVRAAERRLGRPLPARFRLTKRLPPQSGLGAGSSDAAAALDLALALHRTPLDSPTRRAICEDVGSDVAFFVNGGMALCTRRGEVIEPLPHRGVRHVVLVLGGASCSTPVVYKNLAPRSAPLDVAPWREAAARGATFCGGDGPAPFNRLQAAAEAAFPELVVVREKIRAAVGRAPHLSGSGGAYFLLESSQNAARETADRLATAHPEFEVFATASYRAFGGADGGASR